MRFRSDMKGVKLQVVVSNLRFCRTQHIATGPLLVLARDACIMHVYIVQRQPVYEVSPIFHGKLLLVYRIRSKQKQKEVLACCIILD